MFKFVLYSLLTLLAGNATAASAPAHSENILWKFSPSAAAEPTREYCVTTKTRPYSPNLCFGEFRRAHLAEQVQGYILFSTTTSDAKREMFKIVKSTPWQYLKTDTEYVANADVYQRQFTIVDSYGRTSVLTEVFGYMATYPEDSRISPRSITGTLPNGLRVALTNFYFFYK